MPDSGGALTHKIFRLSGWIPPKLRDYSKILKIYKIHKIQDEIKHPLRRMSEPIFTKPRVAHTTIYVDFVKMSWRFFHT